MSTTFSRSISMVACALLLGFSMPVWADDPPEDQGTYQNQAQIDRAKNVSDAYFQAELQRLEEEYAAEEAKGVDANEDVLAELDLKITDWYQSGAGISAAEVEEMRASGMGWGEIAHELGLHPSVLGLGHTKKTGATADIAMATAIDMKSGNGLGHGKSADAAGGKGAEGKSNAGKGQDKDKGDHGNKGGNGGNNGNGGGNKNK